MELLCNHHPTQETTLPTPAIHSQPLPPTCPPGTAIFLPSEGNLTLSFLFFLLLFYHCLVLPAPTFSIEKIIRNYSSDLLLSLNKRLIHCVVGSYILFHSINMLHDLLHSGLNWWIWIVTSVWPEIPDLTMEQMLGGNRLQVRCIHKPNL